MSWQLLIWNIFVWTFVGILIYVKDASMFWLFMPFLFTAFDNGVKLYKKQEASEIDQDEVTRKQIEELVKKYNP